MTVPRLFELFHVEGKRETDLAKILHGDIFLRQQAVSWEVHLLVWHSVVNQVPSPSH